MKHSKLLITLLLCTSFFSVCSAHAPGVGEILRSGFGLYVSLGVVISLLIAKLSIGKEYLKNWRKILLAHIIQRIPRCLAIFSIRAKKTVVDWFFLGGIGICLFLYYIIFRKDILENNKKIFLIVVRIVPILICTVAGILLGQLIWNIKYL